LVMPKVPASVPVLSPPQSLASTPPAPGPMDANFWDFRPHPGPPWLGSVAVMSNETQSMCVLSEAECWNLLSGAALGRLVTSVDGQPEIFPVNFVVQNHTILFRTAEGTKLVSAAINHGVLFEADDHDVAEGWSVIVKGLAHILHTDDEVHEAERAQLLPWVATVKRHYVRIRPLSISGRRFVFGAEPEREFGAV
jgi:uncharacterized protein